MRTIAALPLTLLLAGACSAGRVSAGATTDQPAAASAAADTHYKVTNEPAADLPPEVVAALQRVRVAPPPQEMKVPARPRLRFETSQGDFTVELDPRTASLHTKSFLYLAGRGFFDGTRFHRFADLLEGSPDGKPGRIIQGGDPLSKEEKTRQYAGIGGPGYSVPREINSLKHDKLVIAAARSQDPDSAGSQFYITQDPVHFLDEGYTVFGKVVDGGANALKLRQGDEIKKVSIVK